MAEHEHDNAVDLRFEAFKILTIAEDFSNSTIIQLQPMDCILDALQCTPTLVFVFPTCRNASIDCFTLFVLSRIRIRRDLA